MAELETAYDWAAALAVQHGTLPTGLFGGSARREHLHTLAGWHKAAQLVLAQHSSSTLLPVRFGPTLEHLPAAEAHEPIVMPIELADGRRVRVELRGRTEPLVREAPGSLILAVREPRDANKRRLNDLRGFLDHAALCAAGLAAGAGHQAWTATPDGDAPRAVRYGALSSDEARAWLSTLCADLMSGVHEYLMPCEAVFSHEKAPGTSIADHVETLREGFREYSSQRGPVRHVDRFDPLPDAQAQAIYERRWQPFLSRAPRDDAREGDE
jgi:exodeoxyribonuclease V gamma subunit